MSGISGSNLTNLNAQSLENYVDQTYGLNSGDATFVILNPSTSDKLTYNGNSPSTPTATLSSTYWENDDEAGTSDDPKVIADENDFGIIPDYVNPLEYMTEENYVAESAAFGVGVIGYYITRNAMFTNAWSEYSESGSDYVLAGGNFEYQFALDGSARSVSLLPIVREITTSGELSNSMSSLQEHYAGGETDYLSPPTSGALTLINYNPGDFGIGVPANGSTGSDTEKVAEYEVLEGWAQGNIVPNFNGYNSVVFGTSPEKLGAVITSFGGQTASTGNLYDPSFTDQAYNRQTVSLTQFLSGASNTDPTNVSADFFDANQALLDGQFYGFTVLDTAANVSSIFDALNEDSKLTGITLTDSGTPTLVLTAAQAFNDTTALSDITNTSYDIAIADTAADVSENIDALNADQGVTSIDLTDAATSSLTLTAAQALLDTNALAKISNTSYAITIEDTAADVSANIDALNGNSAVNAITLTDVGTRVLDLTVAQILGDTKVLEEIASAEYSITVEDTASNILTNASALASNANVAGAIVVDTAANVLSNASALDADAQVTSITVVDTVANLLANLSSLQADAKVTSMVVIDTAANVLLNATALAGITEITSTGVVDTAGNVAANIDALNADTSVGWVDFTDNTVPTLTLTAVQTVSDTNLLSKIVSPVYAVDVNDTAAAVTANLDALSKVAALAKITLTDPGTPTLTLTAAQAANDAAVIGMISNSNLEVVIADTATNVTAELDALNADPRISAITLTDTGTPTVTLTVAQVLDDATVLSKINNNNLRLVISDTAADVSANFDALNADAALSSITLTDNGTPTMVLTATQAVNDIGLLAKISNPNYTVAIFNSVANILDDSSSLLANRQVTSITAIDTVANILANATALANSGSTSQFIVDSAANVAANLDAIKVDTSIRAISLSDSGTPTLTLTVAQTIDDAAVLGTITNSSFAIDIIDTAANVTAYINILAANDLIASVALTDDDIPVLSLNVGEAVGDAAFLAKITNASYSIDVTDTAAAVAASLDTLNANAAIGAITLTDIDAPVLNLSVEQALGDTSALGTITNGSYTIAVTDTAANVVASAAALAADARVSSISVVDTAANVLDNEASLAGNPLLASITVVDTAANVVADEAELASINNISAIDVVDSATNVAADFDALNADSSISKITLSDANPVLILTAEQAASDYSAFNKISNPSYSIAIVDTAANVSQYLNQLAYNPSLASITLTDAGTPTLNLPSYLLSSGVLGKIANAAYTVDLIGGSDVSVSTFVDDQAILDAVPGGFGILDSAANVGANIDALNADTHLTSITLTDSQPSLALSAAQAVDDAEALGKITNSNYTISVTDSAANILGGSDAFAANDKITSLIVQDTVANAMSNASALNANAEITSVVIADTASNVVADKFALSILTKPISVDVTDTAADVSAQIDLLNSDTSLSAITLTDITNPILTLTAAQAVNDSNALDEIVNGYGLAIVDTAANVSQDLNALSEISGIASISLTDPQHLSLTLDVADTLNDFNVLSKVANATYDVAVVDTAANVQATLDSLSADPNISSITIQDVGAPVITVTAEQAALDATVLGKIVNATVTVVNTTNISVAEFLAEQSSIDSIGALFSISDTAANVSAIFSPSTEIPTCPP